MKRKTGWNYQIVDHDQAQNSDSTLVPAFVPVLLSEHVLVTVLVLVPVILKRLVSVLVFVSELVLVSVLAATQAGIIKLLITSGL